MEKKSYYGPIVTTVIGGVITGISIIIPAIYRLPTYRWSYGLNLSNLYTFSFIGMVIGVILIIIGVSKIRKVHLNNAIVGKENYECIPKPYLESPQVKDSTSNYCPHCGDKFMGIERYCTNCGNKRP